MERLQLDHEVFKVRCLSRAKEEKKGKGEAKQTHSPETYLDCNKREIDDDGWVTVELSFPINPGRLLEHHTTTTNREGSWSTSDEV